MSHFAVLVIGENPEEQLAPYHEFESTGNDDKYVQDVDMTEEVQLDADKSSLENALSDYDLQYVTVDDEKNIDKEGEHKYRYAVVRDGKLVKAVKRTNPNKKWDWYQLGGRFGGFSLKNGGICPFALKQNIDFDVDSCFVTYAVIKDSKWYSKGDMGWFGISSNDVSDEDWNAKFWELVNSAPDTTLFSLFDCHI